jgi:hypothetical protein
MNSRLTRDQALIGVSTDSQCYKSLSHKMSHDREVALVATRRFGSRTFEHLPAVFKQDKEFALAAIVSNASGLAFCHMSAEQKDDEEIAMIAVKASGHNIEYASKRLQQLPAIRNAVLYDDKRCVLDFGSVPHLLDEVRHAAMVFGPTEVRIIEQLTRGNLKLDEGLGFCDALVRRVAWDIVSGAKTAFTVEYVPHRCTYEHFAIHDNEYGQEESLLNTELVVRINDRVQQLMPLAPTQQAYRPIANIFVNVDRFIRPCSLGNADDMISSAAFYRIMNTNNVEELRSLKKAAECMVTTIPEELSPADVHISALPATHQKIVRRLASITFGHQ